MKVPVTVGGVVVNPGDIVFGDADGIVVASHAHMDAIIDGAEAVVANEGLVLEGLRDGVGLREQLNFDDHFAKVIAGDGTSKLEFNGRGKGKPDGKHADG